MIIIGEAKMVGKWAKMLDVKFNKYQKCYCRDLPGRRKERHDYFGLPPCGLYIL